MHIWRVATSKTDKRAECKHMHLSAYPVEMSVCHVSCRCNLP